ncbi:hypothetical protein [Streptomyces sp. NPDC002588]|uniref:hypothetical protein n=1 Tax=Streptomyces sp. NPDC002588 TaxID=3154419 RepID=UPI00332FC03B
MADKDSHLDSRHQDLDDGFKRGDGNEIWADPNAAVDSGNLEAYLRSLTWQENHAVLVGAAGTLLGQPVPASNEGNRAWALAVTDPASLMANAVAFNYAGEVYRAIGTLMHDSVEVLTGEHGSWHGPGSKAYAAGMETFSKVFLANAEALVGTESLPQKVADDSATLAAAVKLAEDIGLWFADRMAIISGIAAGDSSGKQATGKYKKLYEQYAQLYKDILIKLILDVSRGYESTAKSVIEPYNIDDPFSEADSETDKDDKGGSGSGGGAADLPNLANLLGSGANELANLLGNGTSNLANLLGSGASDLSNLLGSGASDLSNSLGSAATDLANLGGGGGGGDTDLSKLGLDSGPPELPSALGGASGLSGLGDQGGAGGTGDLGDLGGLAGLGASHLSGPGADQSLGDASLSGADDSALAPGLSGLAGLGGLGSALGSSAGGKDKGKETAADLSGLPGLSGLGTDLTDLEDGIPSVSLPGLEGLDDTGSDHSLSGGAPDTSGIATVGGAGSDAGLGTDTLSTAASAPLAAGTVTAESAGASATGGMPYMPMGGMGGAPAAAAQGAGERSEASGLLSRASEPWAAEADVAQGAMGGASGTSTGGAVLELNGAVAQAAGSSTGEAEPVVVPALVLPYPPTAGTGAATGTRGQASDRGTGGRADPAGLLSERHEPWTASEEELRPLDTPFTSTAGPTTAGPTTAGPTTAGPTGAEPITAGPITAGPTGAGPITAGPAVAGPRLARAAVGAGNGTAAAAGAQSSDDDETAAWAVAPGALLSLLWQGRPGRGEAEREQGSTGQGHASADGAAQDGAEPGGSPGGGSGRPTWRPDQSATAFPPDRPTQPTGRPTPAEAAARLEEILARREAEEAEESEEADRERAGADPEGGAATDSDEDRDGNEPRDISALLRQDQASWGGGPAAPGPFT